MDPIQQILLDEFRQHRKESTEWMQEILIQTTKTNGRVTALEGDMSTVKTDVKSLNATDNNTKGSDKIIGRMVNWGGGIVAGVLVSVILYYLLNKN